MADPCTQNFTVNYALCFRMVLLNSERVLRVYVCACSYALSHTFSRITMKSDYKLTLHCEQLIFWAMRYGHLRSTNRAPCSSYSLLAIHISWNWPSDARIEPPSHAQMARSFCPGVIIFTFHACSITIVIVVRRVELSLKWVKHTYRTRSVHGSFYFSSNSVRTSLNTRNASTHYQICDHRVLNFGVAAQNAITNQSMHWL